MLRDLEEIGQAERLAACLDAWSQSDTEIACTRTNCVENYTRQHQSNRKNVQVVDDESATTSRVCCCKSEWQYCKNSVH